MVIFGEKIPKTDQITEIVLNVHTNFLSNHVLFFKYYEKKIAKIEAFISIDIKKTFFK